jgi:DNA invertase Pin-like site-specific DNA recombinase/ribosomal protein S27AE
MKAILLVRVSTEAQDFTEQEREIYQMAINDGYKPEDIIAICEKESGIKLAEEDRAGLNRMKELIEAGGVDCVYCWEVSRIARRKKINFSVLEYLTEHKVQLIIKNPSITLFNRDGSINEGAEVVFTLFSQMAESEMRTKKERFKRSKDARRKQGYFTGGFVLYGYTTDEDKKLIIHPEDSEVVKMIYQMYLTGKYSYRSLAKEVQAMGFFADKTFTTAQTAIKKILCNTAYAGVPSADGSYTKLKTEGNVYPPLVTLEMVEKCKKIAEGNIILPKKKYSTVYFAKGILRCPDCGKVMMAVKSRNFYHCTKCGNKNIININMVDSALWLCASPLYVQKMETKVEGQKEYYETQIVLLNQKIEVAQNDIKGIQKRAEAIEQKAYVDGVMDIAKADKFLAELNQKIEAKQKEITTFQNQIRDFESLLFQYKGEYEGEYMEDVNGITDDSVRYDIVHQMIKWASFSKYENNKMLTEINIYDYLDNKHSYLLDSRNHKIYTEYTPEGKGIVEAEGAFIQRFTSTYQAPDRREEYLAYQKQYREARKNDEATKAANAERQRRFRERKKANNKED